MLLKDLYTLTETEEKDGEFITGLRINKYHPVYEGHFPGRPVTPGVLLMQMFKEEAERRSGHKLRLHTASNTKFMAVVDPNEEEEFRLHLRIIEEEEGFLKLNGTATHKNTTVLKISASYRILS